MKSENILRFLLLCILILYNYNFQGISALNSDTQYTTQEEQALKKLSVAMVNLTYADYQKLDAYLIHFLRWTALDVQKAKIQLKENFKWRKDKKIDTILQEGQMVKMEKKFPIRLDGEDKEGRPILTYILHKWDIRRFILAGNAAAYRRYQIYIIEKVTQRVYQLALAGKDVSQFNILIDLSGFNMRQHACVPCLQALNDFVPLIESRYCNLGHQLIFVNVPRSFGSIMKLLRSLLSQSVQKRLYVFGYDKTEWREHLNKLVDHDQLSATFGGTLQGDD